LSIDDIVGKGKKRGGKVKAERAVQFQDDEGNTWSGRGRMPGWLQGKDKEQYRVQ
jgi:DNA-binding protein H-NS